MKSTDASKSARQGNSGIVRPPDRPRPRSLDRAHHSPFFLTMQVPRTTSGVFRFEWLTTRGIGTVISRRPFAAGT